MNGSHQSVGSVFRDWAVTNNFCYRALLVLLLLCGTAHAQLPGPSTLFAPERCTHTSVKDGRWQDADTWNTGTVPNEAAGDRVCVQPGTHVTIHGGEAAGCRWVNVGGKLDCCDHCDIRFNVETVYIPKGGDFMLGSSAMPCKGKVVVEFTPGEWGEDRAQWGRGILNMGMASIAGLPKTEHGVIANAELPVGATSLTLREPPIGWNPGDDLLLAGTDSLIGEKRVPYQSEYLKITSVAGSTVTFSPPLKYRHYPWRSDLQVHVANLTRNVVLRSRDPGTIGNRGHVMYMMPGEAHYCELVGLGRTDKSKPVTDPRVDAYGEFVAGSDVNVRARYAGIHSHRTGPLEKPTRCRGVVVRGSPGLGMVNHNSNAEWDACIAVECYGAGFFTEEGQERGYMRRCLGALNRGMGDIPGISGDDDHGSGSDWAKAGDAFWLQGGGVEVSDCIAFDNSGRGFALFNRTLNGYPNYGTGNPQPDYLRYEIAHDFSMLTPEHALLLSAAEYQKAPASTLPQQVFARNTAYGNKIGVQGWSGPTRDASGNLIWPLSVRGSITDLTLWGRGGKLHLEYTRQLNVDGVTIVGDNGFRPAFNSISRLGEAVLLRSPEVTVKNWSIEHVSAHMAKFRVEGPNDPGGLAGKNLVIEGATINADGSVTIP